MSSKMRKKRAAARAAAEAAAPPPREDEPSTPAPFNPAPAAMPSILQSPPPSDASDWDLSALTLLKKLGKRDGTTRLRALSELADAIASAPSGSGTAFLDRFAAVFSSLIADGHPRVRAGSLTLAGAAAQKFRGLCRHALPQIAPHWVAATADPVATVVAAAHQSLATAFPTSRQRGRFAQFVSRQLTSFCFDEHAALSSNARDKFAERAARVCAVAAWPADPEVGLPDLLAEFIDDSTRPLAAIAEGMQAAGGAVLSAPAPVCRAGVALLSGVDARSPTDAQALRAEQFGEIALAGLEATPAAWDLLLVVAAKGWSSALGDKLPGLGDALAAAIRAPGTQPLAALLPLLAALPAGESTATVAEQSIDALREVLGLDEKAKKPMLAQALRMLPPYVECARFAYATGVERWEVPGLRARAAEGHLAPVLRAVLSGEMTPCPRRARSRTGRTPPDPAAGAVRQVAKAVAALDEADAEEAAQPAAEAFVGALTGTEQDASSLAARYALVLQAMGGSACARALGTAVAERVVSAQEGGREDGPDGDGSGPAGDGDGDADVAHDPVRVALLRAVADSVAAVPGVGDESLCRRGAEFAAARAGMDAAAAGSILAWACDADEFDGACGLLAGAEESVQFGTFAAMVAARRRQRPEGEMPDWSPYAGVDLDNLAARAGRVLQARGQSSGAAVGLLAELLVPAGGAALSDAQGVEITRIAANCLRASEANVVSLVKAALAPSSDGKDAGTHLVGLAASALFWGPDPVVELATGFLKEAPASSRDHVVAALLSELTPAVLRPSADLERVASLWDKAVQALCTQPGASAVHLNAKLLELVESPMGDVVQLPVKFLAFVVLELPLDQLFGDVDNDDFNSSLFLAAYGQLSTLSGQSAEDARRDMEEHIDTLPPHVRAQVAAEAFKRVLDDRDRLLLGIIARTVTPGENDAGDASRGSAKAIASLLGETFAEQKQKGSKLDPAVCVLAVEALEICTACTKRASLDCFRPTLEQATNAIRGDPNSRLAQFGVMLLSASLVSAPDMSLLPKWLADLVVLALGAVRRFQQTMRRIPGEKAKKGALSASPLGAGSVLMARAMGAMPLHVDEWRFWSMAAQDSLLDAQYADPKRPAHQSTVANIATLAEALVRADDAGAAPQKLETDQLCKVGAWAAVSFLSAVDCATDTAAILPMNPGGLAALVVLAAERGVLVSLTEPLPLAPKKVYALTPLLGSGRGDVRRATLVALVHAASVDLPAVVKRDYPENGFATPKKERNAIREMIPEPLRVALEWTRPTAGGASSETEDAGLLRELAYFLAWRVFLELLANPIDVAETRTGGEEISFRRVGISYLLANEGLFEEFFRRATTIVVEGDPAEKDAAAEATQRILAAGAAAAGKPAPKPQGAQLARAASSGASAAASASDERHQPLLDHLPVSEKSEREAGAAAGAAFARALQRLPALSRRLGTERLNHALARSTEQFVEAKVAPLLAAAEIEKVRAWGAFGGAGDGDLRARGSVAAREVVANYTFSDVTLEICLSLPAAFPLRPVTVEARSRKGMSEARWRKTILGMTTLLRNKDGSLVEAVELWRRNLDRTFEGMDECPICYSVLHLSSAALPKMRCKTCKNMFHSECLLKWFTKSNASACPLCRSAF